MKKTRFKLALVSFICLMIVIGVAMFKDMESIASQALAGVMVIVPVFIAGDSYRKSDKDEPKSI
jgi:hypothetical protein